MVDRRSTESLGALGTHAWLLVVHSSGEERRSVTMKVQHILVME